jgi:peroxiredoxin
MRHDIVPGAVFPDYQLPDHTGTPRRLSDLQGDDPLILTLARGHYCPKEHQQHLVLAALYPRIAVAYTQVATIATDDHHTLQEFRASVGAQWTFLSDPEGTVQKDLDIAEYTDPEHNPMVPQTLVLKPGLIVHTIYNGYWFWGRPSFGDLWRDLRDVTRQIRPDWDLSGAGLQHAVRAIDSPAIPKAWHLQSLDVIRTSKPAVTEDVLAELVVSTRVLGSAVTMLLDHTGCGFTRFTDAKLNAMATAPLFAQNPSCRLHRGSVALRTLIAPSLLNLVSAASPAGFSGFALLDLDLNT